MGYLNTKGSCKQSIMIEKQYSSAESTPSYRTAIQIRELGVYKIRQGLKYILPMQDGQEKPRSKYCYMPSGRKIVSTIDYLP